MMIFLFITSSIASVRDISVLLAKDQKKVAISSTNVKRIFKNKDESSYFQGKKKFQFNCDKKEYSDQNQKIEIALKGETNKFKWKNKTYPGSAVLTSRPGSDSCNLIANIPFEKYVALTLTKEMNPNWPIEVLKAQAVAARSYAYFKLKKSPRTNHFDLLNSEMDQVNGSIEQETKNSIKAAKQTQNQILTGENKEILPIFYHSNCGGRTLLPSKVWSGKISEYKEVSCPYCYNNGKNKWTRKIPKENFYRKISHLIPKNGKFELFDKNEFSLNLEVHSYQSNQVISKPKLRKIFGRKKLPSNRFHMNQLGHEVIIEGRGNGHGVGMCQIGALELARKGLGYKEILKYYYPNFNIVNIETL